MVSSDPPVPRTVCCSKLARLFWFGGGVVIGSVCDKSCQKLVPDVVQWCSGNGVSAGPVEHVLQIFRSPSSMAINEVELVKKCF